MKKGEISFGGISITLESHLHKPIASITGLVNWQYLFSQFSNLTHLSRYKKVEAALTESISLYHARSRSQNPSPLHLLGTESCQLELSNTTRTCIHDK